MQNIAGGDLPSNFLLRAKGDLIYAFLLFISALTAFLLRQFSTIEFRRKVEGLIGLTIVLIVSGPMALCSLFLVIGHLILLKTIKQPKLMTNLSFFGTFAYLGALRIMHFVGFPRLEFVTNAVQLILTLRAIGFSYEITDLRQAKKEDENSKMSSRISEEPTLFEAFNYLYSFIGLFTGPYYMYAATYSDAFRHWKRPLGWHKLRPLIMKKMSTLCWSLPALIFMTWMDPVNAIRGPNLDKFDGKLPLLFLWVALAFVHLRMRIYSAWMVAESICLLAGIGIYPKLANSEAGRGPKNLALVDNFDWSAEDTEMEFDDETITNLDIPRVEHSDGFRSGIRAWNRTVQFWLANFIYRRCGSRTFRLPYTMLVSSFWHGVHPGYFLSFLTVPLCTAAEDKLFSAFPEANRPKWIQILWSFIRMRGFEFMAAGFLLLDGWHTLALWSKMFFHTHLTMLAVLIGIFSWENWQKRQIKRGELVKEE